MSAPQPSYNGVHPLRGNLLNGSSYGPPSTASTISQPTLTTVIPGVATLIAPPQSPREETAQMRSAYPPHPPLPPMHNIAPRYVPPPHTLPYSDTVAAHPTMTQMPEIPELPSRRGDRRKRRTEPSCRSCKERKVRCDAKGDDPCKECVVRGIECVAPPGASKKGSSTRDLQDVRQQLTESNAQNALLEARIESLLHSQGKLEVMARSTSDSSANMRPLKRQRRGNLRDASRVGRNLRLYGRNIFRTEFESNSTQTSLGWKSREISLPPIELVEGELRRYTSYPYDQFPFFNADYYQNCLTDIYGTESSTRTDRIAVLLGFFAANATTKHPDEADKAAQSLLDLLSTPVRSLSLDVVRALIFAAINLIETNELSPAYQLLGQAVRAGQELGLDCHSGSSGDTELQRCALWCSLYYVESLLAVQLGLPSMFLGEDHYAIVEWAGEQLAHHRYNRLHFDLNLAKAAISINRLQKAKDTSEGLLALVDEQLDRIAAITPPPRSQQSSTEDLDLSHTLATIYQQSLRLLLHRHQTNSSYNLATRIKAAEYCIRICLATCESLERIVHVTGGGNNLVSQLQGPERLQEVALAANTYFCRHLWRCFLFMVAFQHYKEAKLCAEVCAAIGTSKATNEPCGRYAEFFLRYQEGTGPRFKDVGAFIEDEEMMAYLSADLQGTFDQAVGWQEYAESESSSSQSATEDKRQLDLHHGAWEGIVKQMEILVSHKSESAPLRPILPPVRSDGRASGGQQVSPSTRMSIADII